MAVLSRLRNERSKRLTAAASKAMARIPITKEKIAEEDMLNPYLIVAGGVVAEDGDAEMNAVYEGLELV